MDAATVLKKREEEEEQKPGENFHRFNTERVEWNGSK